MGSLARKTDRRDRAKYQGYLTSNAWRARRRKYFDAVRANGFEPACQVCFITQSEAGSLDLHHVSYDGVEDLGNGRYRSTEADEDLVPLCRIHHEQLHQVFDIHRRSYYDWDRRRATVVVVNYLRKSLKKQGK